MAAAIHLTCWGHPLDQMDGLDGFFALTRTAAEMARGEPLPITISGRSMSIPWKWTVWTVSTL